MKPHPPISWLNDPEKQGELERRMMLGEYHWPCGYVLPIKNRTKKHITGADHAFLVEPGAALMMMNRGEDILEGCVYFVHGAIYCITEKVILGGEWKSVDDVMNEGWIVD